MRLLNLFRTWAVDFLDNKHNIDLTNPEYTLNKYQLMMAEMAIDRASDIIGKNIAKCEFKTFANNEEVKKAEWIAWNVRPNKNQSAVQFKKCIGKKLVNDGECLIIRNLSGEYLIADDYDHTEHCNINDEFADITVKDYTFPNKYYQDQVIFIKMQDEKQQQLMNYVYSRYDSLIAHAAQSYLNSYTKKIRVSVNATATAGLTEKESLQKLIKNDLTSLFSEGNSAIVQRNGMSYEDFGSFESTIPASEMISMRKDIYEMVANAYGLSVDSLEGKSTDFDASETQNINAVIPFIDEIENVLNYQIFKTGIINGNKFMIDKSKMVNINVFKNAVNIDKLLSSGLFSVNDMRVKLGEARINEEWADKHYLTKNYSSIDNLLELGGSNGIE